VNQNAGDLHLLSNSPCINSGKNIYVAANADLDGHPRIVAGTVDVGVYEYQTPASVLSYAWAQQFALPIDGTADNTDNDGDGMSNYAEWKAGTIPTNNLSVLQLATPVPTNNPAGLVVSWQSVTNVTYFLQRSLDSVAFASIQSNLAGRVGTTSFTDTNASGAGPFFYRVGVQ
jgi:hypothetical protein